MEKSKKIKIGVGAAVVIIAAAAFMLTRGTGQTGSTGGQGAPGMEASVNPDGQGDSGKTGGASGSQDGSGKTGGAPGGMGGAQTTSSTVVMAAIPYTGDLSVTTALTGDVEPADVVYVYAKAAGDVTSVDVKAGDTVTAGQLLVTIDTEQVDTAKNQMESAQVNLNKAQSDLSRMQILYNGGELSEQDYEQYSNSLKSAQLTYDNAKLAYEKQVGYSSVTAPIAGKIESVDVEVHDRATTNTQLCVIAGESGKNVSFYVSERMMDNIAVGDELSIEKSGNSYTATITEISSMVDSTTGLFKVKAMLADTDAIATGSTVKLELVTEKAENAMLVPVDALYYSGNDAYVYLYQDGVAKQTPVEVGIYDNVSAEILSGLNKDDIVVSTWSSNLYEGARISVKAE